MAISDRFLKHTESLYRRGVFWASLEMLYKNSKRMRIHILKSDLTVKPFLTFGALSFAVAPMRHS